MPSRCFVLLSALFLSWPHPGSAQVPSGDASRNVVVRVTDAETGLPLPVVVVRDRIFGLEAMTDSKGTLPLYAWGSGTLELEFTRRGYRDNVQVLPLGLVKAINVELVPIRGEDPVLRNGIEGVVTDADTGTPLEGAYVASSDPNVSAVSGSGGRFSLRKLPPGHRILSVSRLGFGDVEVSVELREGIGIDLHVSLSSDPIALDPVIVLADPRRPVGKMVDMTSLGARTEVSEFGSASTLAEVLQWQVPGVQVEYDRAGNINVQVRGMSSISNQGQPLVIVDGMPVDSSTFQWALQRIHPSQIESIEVLRDVASTSIFGLRGAQGVILVTLRRLP